MILLEFSEHCLGLFRTIRCQRQLFPDEFSSATMLNGGLVVERIFPKSFLR